MIATLARKCVGLLRPVYAVAALLALIHIALLIGVGVFAYTTGRVDRETIEGVAAVLRGKPIGSPPVGVVDAAATGPQASADTSAQMIQDTLEAEEMERFKQQRALADLRQLDMLWNRRALKLQKDQEAFDARVEAYAAQRRKRQEQDLGDAHKKLIATVAQMDPKKSRDFLLNSSDADALRILLELSVRKRKSILESCKSASETEWRDRMLEAMARQPADLPVDGQTAGMGQ